MLGYLNHHAVQHWYNEAWCIYDFSFCISVFSLYHGHTVLMQWKSCIRCLYINVVCVMKVKQNTLRDFQCIYTYKNKWWWFIFLYITSHAVIMITPGEELCLDLPTYMHSLENLINATQTINTWHAFWGWHVPTATKGKVPKKMSFLCLNCNLFHRSCEIKHE